jgi:YD repeat-containing protein
MGRVKNLTKTIAGDTARTTIYYYDVSGRLKQMTYPDGFQAYYAFIPGTGLLDKVTAGSDLLEYAVYSGYQPTGKIGRIDHGNGTATIYDYDSLSTRLMKITTHDATGLPANDIQRKRYEYSGAGDIEAIIDEKDSNKTYAYVYDGLHRLTSESINGVTAESYVYSAI